MFEERIAAMNQRTEEAMAANAVQFDKRTYTVDEIQDILLRCGRGEIYIVNPYECFLLMCLLTDCPLAVFSEIWEKSYEEGEAEEA